MAKNYREGYIMKNIWIQRMKCHWDLDWTDENDPYLLGDTIKERFECIYNLMHVICNKHKQSEYLITIGVNIAYMFETTFWGGGLNWITPWQIPIHNVGLFNQKFRIVISSLVEQNTIYIHTSHNKIKSIRVKNLII